MQIENINIPDEWCAKLIDLQQIAPNSIIAGGALRDLYTGHQPKDVDFFSDSTTLPTWADGPQESNIDYKGMKYVLGVAEYKGNNLPYQVVIHEPIAHEALLESFDIGLCQIGFDGKSLIKTEAFLWDIKHNIMTLRHIDRYPRSILRYARINQRYNMELHIPELDRANALPR